MKHAPYTYEETVKAANQAFKEGRLGFQKLERARIGCRYRYPDGGCCAIGARLTDKEARGIPEIAAPNAFQGLNIFEQYKNNKLGNILDIFIEFQDFHDDLCVKVKRGTSIEQAEAKWRKKFIT